MFKWPKLCSDVTEKDRNTCNIYFGISSPRTVYVQDNNEEKATEAECTELVSNCWRREGILRVLASGFSWVAQRLYEHVRKAT